MAERPHSNVRVKGSWVYIAGARESDFRKTRKKKKKKAKARRPDTEEAAASNLGVIRFERMVDGSSWVYAAGAWESDFRGEEKKKSETEKPALSMPTAPNPGVQKFQGKMVELMEVSVSDSDQQTETNGQDQEHRLYIARAASGAEY
ncbi:hypothetical protein N0V85_007254 [Neurospora sp. IMI 360204]|nr:hypothetical protein N0V85_007254 [Neurospora sp. IMI 360204]